jgi:hypothetical protein
MAIHSPGTKSELQQDKENLSSTTTISDVAITEKQQRSPSISRKAHRTALSPKTTLKMRQ